MNESLIQWPGIIIHANYQLPCQLGEFVFILQSDSSDFKSRMERMMGTADENFRGKDLATLIRNKYGRSYDVQFIRKVKIIIPRASEFECGSESEAEPEAENVSESGYNQNMVLNLILNLDPDSILNPILNLNLNFHVKSCAQGDYALLMPSLCPPVKR